MKTPEKRRGRPPNTLRSETRIPFNIRVTPAVKDVIERQAQANGHTNSQEVVRLIELGLRYEAERIGRDTTGGVVSVGDMADMVRRMADLEKLVKERLGE